MAIQVPQFTSVISANPTKRNAGAILGAGNETDDIAIKGYLKFYSLDLMVNNLNPYKLQGILIPNNNTTGMGFIQEGAPVTITSITQSGLFCLITKTSNGLAVGTPIQVNGTSVVGYNVIHTVKAILNANAFQTDIPYSSNAGTPGTYSLQAGTRLPNTPKYWVASLVCTQLAGISNNALFMMGASNVMPYNPSNGSYGISITGIDYFTGNVTKGATWGVLNPFWNISGNTTLASEPIPTMAIPGELVFTTGAFLPMTKDYNPKTV